MLDEVVCTYSVGRGGWYSVWRVGWYSVGRGGWYSVVLGGWYSVGRDGWLLFDLLFNSEIEIKDIMNRKGCYIYFK